MSASAPRYASVVFDADSTLASIEGIDWLADLAGPLVGAEVAELTAQAMAGDVPIDAVYAERLARIRPTRAQVAALADAYCEAVEPGVAALVARLMAAGVRVAIVSGGLRQALLPLAESLGVAAELVFAVELRARSADSGVAADQPEDLLDALLGPQPLATQDGKVQVLSDLLARGVLTRPVVMVGDGSTDAAVRGTADAFIAYTRVARRPAVVAAANAEAPDMAALEALLFAPEISVDVAQQPPHSRPRT